MPGAMRERLHREVLRQSEKGSSVPEPVPIPAAEALWRRWRAFAGMVGVGLGAIAVLVVMSRSGQERNRRNLPSVAVASEGAMTSEVMTARAPSFAGGERMVVPAGLDVPLALSSPAPALVLSDSLSPEAPANRTESSAAKKVRTLDGMVRLRRRYQAAGESNSTPPTAGILRRFEVVRAPDRVELRDDDGSVYIGRVVSGIVPREGGLADWVFEGRGTNLPLGKVVLITGHFGAAPESRQSRESGADHFMDAPFVGTAVIGEAQVVEVRAHPEP